MYDFDTVVDRRNTGSLKWDVAENELPMWVADMDFKTAPQIIEAISARVSHGVFGYSIIPDEWNDAYISWWDRRHGLKIERDSLIFCTGVVPAISSTVRKLTTPGENVLIMTPVYNIFFNSIFNNGVNVQESPLGYENGRYFVDYDRLEHDLSNPQTSLMIFCNPHNPCGRVWPREDLERVADICRRNGVIVISDEIHCELEMPGYHFTPMASLSQASQDNTVTMNSPSKSFNIAGLGISNIITNNPDWKKLIDRVININELCDVNPFGVLALQAAYNAGEAWLKELNEYVYANYRAMVSFFEERLPEFPVTKLEGTYLAWADVRALNMCANDIENSLLQTEKVWINSGVMYGLDGFMRINIACPRKTLAEGLERIRKVLG